MVDTNNPEFQMALKEFDAKRYEKVEKLCDRMISKNPKDDQALALKGLNYYFLQKPELGEQILKQALKANFKSPVAWHFYAIFHKERGNYSQAMKSYNKALNFAPTNFNIIRDLSYMQLYLRQLDSFVQTCKLGVENKPGMLINWVTLAFSYSLVKDYKSALAALNSVEKLGKETLKKNDIHELKLFNAMIQSKDKKYEEAMNYLIHFKSELIDKPMVYDMIVQNAIKAKKYNIGLDYCTKALNLNPDNINLILYYFIMKINQNDFQPKTYNDLLNIQENYKYLKDMTEVLYELKNNYPKSKIIKNLELSFSQNEEFEKKFENYFITQLEITIPSIFINIQFIYKLQPHKIKIIQKILDKYNANIKSSSKINDNLDLPIHVAWVYFYEAQHYLFLSELEEAINYINVAIDITPSVIEFYMVAAKIFKHSYMIDNYILAYDKARMLDVGDRYLNAKTAKIYLRSGDIEKNSELMKEFVSDPLTEENIKFTETLWYLNECGGAFLIKKNIIRSHYCFRNVINVFLAIIKDQVDFYNFCLRRNMLKDLYHTIVFLNGIAKNKYVIQALIKIDIIYNYLKANENNKELEEKFIKEYEKMKEEYSIKEYLFKNITELVKTIEKDFYEVLIKLQKIYSNEEIHYLCVKYFLKNDKLLMAIKSIKILSENKNSFYYNDSLKLVKLYLQEKKDALKGKEIIIDKVNEYIKDENQIEEYKEPNKLMNLKIKLYQKNLFENPKENNDIIFEYVNCQDKKQLRKLRGEEINNLMIFSALYTDEEGIKELKNKLKEKMKLINVDEKEIARNLNFYEDKKFN
jgi:peptide alpha-N-acetyltransferase